jgi:hypothetical protein
MNQMDRIISTFELSKVANHIINYCSSKIDTLIGLNVPVNGFVSDNALQSMAWMAAKDQLSDHLLVIKGATVAYDSMREDAHKLLNAVSGDVEVFVESNILSGIEFANQRIRELTEQVSSWHRLMFSMPDDFLNISRIISLSNESIREYTRFLGLLEERYRRLEEIDAITKSLFIDSQRLFAEVDIGWACIKTTWNGSNFIRNQNTSWRINLQSAWFDRGNNINEVVNIKVNELINSIREKGIPFPNDWSEEDKHRFAQRYLSEMKEFNSFIRKNFTTTDFRVDYEMARAAQTAHLFLSDIDLAFHLTFKQRLELIEVVRNSGGMDNIVENALLKMELNISNDNNKSIWGINTGIGDVRWLAHVALQTLAAAEMGTTYHDRMTSLVAGGWIDASARLGSAAGPARSTIQSLKKPNSGTSGSPNGVGNKPPTRPTWRQSELDVQKQFPNHQPQQSFLNGQKVPYGTRGSVRPDLFRSGQSIEVKNYNVQTASGRSSLVNNVSNQVNQRATHLPSGTNQKVVVDVRGQNVSNAQLKEIRNSILENSNVNVEIVFKR